MPKNEHRSAATFFRKITPDKGAISICAPTEEFAERIRKYREDLENDPNIRFEEITQEQFEHDIATQKRVEEEFGENPSF